MRLLGNLVDELRRIGEIAGARCMLEFTGKILLHAPEIMRTKRLTSADQAMASRDRLFRVLGCEISLPGKLFGFAREVYGRLVYFSVPGFDLRPTDTVVDLGANNGVFTVLAALRGRRVVAVEAIQEFTENIRLNSRRNNCLDKVDVELGIVGPASGMYVDAQVLEYEGQPAPRPGVLSMEEIIAKHGLEMIDFMKVDIEGSEFSLFSGDLVWLPLVRRMVLEVHSEYGDIPELAGILERNGFLITQVKPDRTVVPRLEESRGFLFCQRTCYSEFREKDESAEARRVAGDGSGD